MALRYSLTIFALWIFLLHQRVCSIRKLEEDTQNKTLVLGFAIPWSRGLSSGARFGSAPIPAINEVKKRNILPQYDVNFVFRDSYCEYSRGMQIAVDVWKSVEHLNALFAACSVVCEPTSLLAAAWGIPAIGYGCSSPGLSDKTHHPTFTRMISSATMFADVIQVTMDIFEWERVSIFTDTANVNKLLTESLRAHLQSVGKKVFYHVAEPTVEGNRINKDNLEKLSNIIKTMKTEAQIHILVAHPADLRNFLLLALDEGMMDGTFAFLSTGAVHFLRHPYRYRPEADPFIFNGLLNVDNIYDFVKADNFLELAQDVINAFQDPRYDGWSRLSPTANPKDVHFAAGCIYFYVIMQITKGSFY